MGDHNGPTRGVIGPKRSQGDGRKYIPHAVTAILSIALSLGAAHFAHIAAPTTNTSVVTRTVENAGVCAYFGPDGSGKTRFQVSAPTSNGACSKGTFVSVVPGG